jgi:hypothetical protein
MEDKILYNKIMLIAFCLIVVLLCAGAYSYITGSNDTDVPRGKAQVVTTQGAVPLVPFPFLL